MELDSEDLKGNALLVMVGAVAAAPTNCVDGEVVFHVRRAVFGCCDDISSEGLRVDSHLALIRCFLFFSARSVLANFQAAAGTLRSMMPSCMSVKCSRRILQTSAACKSTFA